MTSANTTLLSPTHLSWTVTVPSKSEMPRGGGRVEKGHSPRLRTSKAGLAASQGTGDLES